MIPIIQVLRSGREVVVGQASNMNGASRLLSRLTKMHPNREYYIDCARTAEEAIADAQLERDPLFNYRGPDGVLGNDFADIDRRW